MLRIDVVTVFAQDAHVKNNLSFTSFYFVLAEANADLVCEKYWDRVAAGMYLLQNNTSRVKNLRIIL